MPTAISSLHDANDWFVLFPKARMQIDAYTFLNPGSLPPGIVDNGPNRENKSTLFLRRARLEIIGTIARHFDYMLGRRIRKSAGDGHLRHGGRRLHHRQLHPICAVPGGPVQRPLHPREPHLPTNTSISWSGR